MKKIFSLLSILTLCLAAAPKYAPIPEDDSQTKSNQAIAADALHEYFAAVPENPSNAPIIRAARKSDKHFHPRIFAVAAYSTLFALCIGVIWDFRRGVTRERDRLLSSKYTSSPSAAPAPVAPPIDNAHVADGCQKFSDPVPPGSPVFTV